MSERHQTYSVDPAARPACIDWVTAPPGGTPRTHLGVYKVERDRLTLAVAARGAERPAGFDSSRADETQVFVLKRVDKTKD